MMNRVRVLFAVLELQLQKFGIADCNFKGNIIDLLTHLILLVVVVILNNKFLQFCHCYEAKIYSDFCL